MIVSYGLADAHPLSRASEDWGQQLLRVKFEAQGWADKIDAMRLPRVYRLGKDFSRCYFYMLWRSGLVIPFIKEAKKISEHLICLLGDLSNIT
jgi:hypothetical protein